MNRNASAGVGDTPAAMKTSFKAQYKAHRGCSSIDIKEIARFALQHSEDVVNHFAPGGSRKGDEYVVRNPTRADSKPGSFSINLRKGIWSDFASDDNGTDLVALIAYLRNVKQLEAAILLSEFLGISNFGVDRCDGVDTFPKGRQVGSQQANQSVTPVSTHSEQGVDANSSNTLIPIPISALPPPPHPKRGLPSNYFPYHTAEGEISHYSCRFNTETGKAFVPLTYNGTWQWKLNDAPRPLYHLDKIVKRGEAKLVIVEGEGKADKAQSLLPVDFVVTTTMNGAQSASKADWSVVKGRDLAFWRDNDEPGLRYQRTCIELAIKNGANSIKVVYVDPNRSQWQTIACQIRLRRC